MSAQAIASKLNFNGVPKGRPVSIESLPDWAHEQLPTPRIRDPHKGLGLTAREAIEKGYCRNFGQLYGWANIKGRKGGWSRHKNKRKEQPRGLPNLNGEMLEWWTEYAVTKDGQCLRFRVFSLEQLQKSKKAASQERIGWSAQEIIKRYPDPAGHLIPLIKKWATEGLTPEAIAEKLNDKGHRTRHGLPWASTTVTRIIDRPDDLAPPTLFGSRASNTIALLKIWSTIYCKHLGRKLASLLGHDGQTEYDKGDIAAIVKRIKEREEREWTEDGVVLLPTWVVKQDHGISHKRLVNHAWEYPCARATRFLDDGYFHPKESSRPSRRGYKENAIGWPKKEVLQFAKRRDRRRDRLRGNRNAATDFLTELLDKGPVYALDAVRLFHDKMGKTGMSPELSRFRLYEAKDALKILSSQPNGRNKPAVWYRDGQDPSAVQSQSEETGPRMIVRDGTTYLALKEFVDLSGRGTSSVKQMRQNQSRVGALGRELDCFKEGATWFHSEADGKQIREYDEASAAVAAAEKDHGAGSAQHAAAEKKFAALKDRAKANKANAQASRKTAPTAPMITGPTSPMRSAASISKTVIVAPGESSIGDKGSPVHNTDIAKITEPLHEIKEHARQTSEDIREIKEKLTFQSPSPHVPNAGTVNCAPDEEILPDAAMTLVPGGFQFRGKIFDLTGKPLNILKVAITSRDHRFTIDMLKTNVWDGDQPSPDTVRFAVGQLRKSLRIAFNTDENPLPNVGAGKDLSWRLVVPK